MPILLEHLQDIDELKDKIDKESEQILKVINLNHLITLNKQEKIEYLKEILYDFWEAQDDKIKQALKLGEKKARNLINAI